MSRSFTLLLLLMCLISSCSLLNDKVIVSSDAYVSPASNKLDSRKIFLKSDVSEKDLSKLPYYQKISRGLRQQGAEMVDAIEKSDLVLDFDVEVQSPVMRTEYTVGKSHPTTSTITEKGADGKSKTVEVKTEGEWQNFAYDYISYRKVLRLKLYTRHKGTLVWQSETAIDDKVNTYAPYVNPLVYTALRNFLRNTPVHPELTKASIRKEQYLDSYSLPGRQW